MNPTDAMRSSENAIIWRDRETGHYRVRLMDSGTVAGLFRSVEAAERYVTNVGATVIDIRT